MTSFARAAFVAIILTVFDLIILGYAPMSQINEVAVELGLDSSPTNSAFMADGSQQSNN